MTQEQNINNSEVITVAPQKKKKKKIASLDRKKARAGWFFVLPFLIGFVCLYLPMLIESIKFSFCEINLLDSGGYTLTWVGFDNYKEAFLGADSEFAETLVMGLQQMLFDIPAVVIFSLFMAILLNQKMVGRAAFRAIFFIPVIISTGIMTTINSADILQSYMEEAGGSETGGSSASEIVSAVDFERLFANMKIGTGLLTYVTDIINNIYGVVNKSGVQMLIFLSGLQSISPAIYESCKIDGATAWETFWKVTFPMISPMILVNSVYTIIDAFTRRTSAVMSYINGADGPGPNLATTMSWIYFLIVVVILAVVSGIISSFIFYQRRD